VSTAASSGAWTLALQAVDDVARATSWLRFRAPRGVEVEPGQFFMLAPARPSGVVFLGRPFSIGDVRGGEWHFLLRALGHGTGWLRGLPVGTPVRVVGPLGRPFARSRARLHRLVAGGVGLAPFFYLARRLRAAAPQARIELLYGERSAPAHTQFEPVEEALFDRIERFTDDGSLGLEGTVVEGAEPALGDRGIAWYGCGPHPMLRALAARLLARGVERAQFSMEERMGCGFGVCQACVVIRRDPPPRYRLLCVEGPVVDPVEVAW
jgi:dihydroorotate dehydrogenase electron transfer subunit